MKRLINITIAVLLVYLLIGCSKTYVFDVSEGNPYRPKSLTNKTQVNATNSLLMYHIVKNAERYKINEMLDKLIVARTLKHAPNYRKVYQALASEGLIDRENAQLISVFKRKLSKMVTDRYNEQQLAAVIAGQFKIVYEETLIFNKMTLSSSRNSYDLPSGTTARSFRQPLSTLPVTIEGVYQPKFSVPFSNDQQQRNLVLSLKGKIGKSNQNWFRVANVGTIDKCEIKEYAELEWNHTKMRNVRSDTKKIYKVNCSFVPSLSGVVGTSLQVINYYLNSGNGKIE